MMDGVRHDKGKPRTDLLPVDSLVAIAEVFRWGCEDKPNPYPERNWEKGMEWHKLYAPVLRHLFAWWSGEDYDPESGLPHIDHAATSMLMLQASVRRGIGEDDRPIERKEVG
jgi:hypothetical protein